MALVSIITPALHRCHTSQAAGQMGSAEGACPGACPEFTERPALLRYRSTQHRGEPAEGAGVCAPLCFVLVVDNHISKMGDALLPPFADSATDYMADDAREPTPYHDLYKGFEIDRNGGYIK